MTLWRVFCGLTPDGTSPYGSLMFTHCDSLRPQSLMMHWPSAPSSRAYSGGTELRLPRRDICHRVSAFGSLACFSQLPPPPPVFSTSLSPSSTASTFEDFLVCQSIQGDCLFHREGRQDGIEIGELSAQRAASTLYNRMGPPSLVTSLLNCALAHDTMRVGHFQALFPSRPTSEALEEFRRHPKDEVKLENAFGILYIHALDLNTPRFTLQRT